MKQGGRSGKFLVRLECIFLMFALLFSSLTLGGCTRKKTKKEKEEQASRASASKAFRDATKEESETEEEIEEPSETEPLSDDEARPRAQEIAKTVGLSEEDLRGKYSLFLRYADAIEGNPDLLDFDGYMYKLFPIVADHLKSENESYFLRKVNSLSFEILRGEDADMWGGYSPDPNRIQISASNYDSSPAELKATGVYHELMHFLDSSIDGTTAVGSATSYDPMEGEGEETLEAVYWVEGGSELFYSRYLSHAPETGAYLVGEQFLVALEYIFGSDMVEEYFFSHETDPLFIQLLWDNGFSDEEIVKLYHVMQKMGDRSEITDPENYMDPQEALIRLYINRIGPDYEKDAAFCRILATMDDDLLKVIPSSYREFTNTLKGFSGSEEKSFLKRIREEKGYSSEGMYFLLPPSPAFVDGELKLTGLFYAKEDGKTVTRSAVMDLDFTTNTISALEVFDDWVPVTIEKPKFSSDASSEGKDFVASQMQDNSSAHDLRMKGSDDSLSGLYARAKNIAFTYGIEVWFGDLTPSGALYFDDIIAYDPDLISNALDQIEEVLAVYPRDYLEQFLFKYYTGVAICLYYGNFEYNNPSHLLLKNKNYLMFYVDVGLDRVQGYAGAYSIKSSYFPSAGEIACQLICDIWHQTEVIMKNRNAFFDEVTYSDTSWQALNPKGLKYLYTEDMETLSKSLSKEDSVYFLSAGALASPENDRLLTYEYMMLCALTGTSPSELSPEFMAKITEIENMIRFYFSSDKWGTSTSWEDAIKNMKVTGQEG